MSLSYLHRESLRYADRRIRSYYYVKLSDMADTDSIAGST